MPDFKNLNPILINPDQQLPNLPSPSTPIPNNYGPLTTDLSGRNNGDPIFGNGPEIGKGLLSTVTANELYENRRYDMFSRDTIDIEDQNANAQSALTQATNGILKGVNLAATTVAGSFGMLYGLAKSPFSGRLADIWDNPAMQMLDEYNNEVDQNYLPNYYTDKEKNASWYSPDNWWKTNFLFDKLVKNSGFAVGAMLSGNIANAAIKGTGAVIGGLAAEGAIAAEASQAFKLFTPLLKGTSRAFSAGKNIEAAAILEKNISSIADLSARESAILNIAKTKNAIAGFQDKFRRTVVAAYSSAGEASFEALQTSNEYRNNLIKQYKENHFGEEPQGADLDNINTISESVGKTSFFGNLALLSVTEYAQLNKLLGSSYAADKQAANSLLGRADDVLLKEGGYAAVPGAATRFGKLYEKSARVGKYVFDPKEAVQELGQYALQVGTQNYFNKGYDGKNASVWTDGFLYGMLGEDEAGKDVGALVSKEGIESGILGGITGGLMQTFGPSGEIARSKAAKSNTERFINELNNAPTFQAAYKEKLEAVDRFTNIQEQQQNAIIQGDELEARDLNADLYHTYLAPRIKFGRFDMIMDDIKDLRQAGMSDKGLSDLKEEGVANINDTVESFQKRLSLFENTAKNTQELYKSVNLSYGGAVMQDAEGGTYLDASGNQIRKYSPLIIDKMVYAAAKIADYDIRIPQVSARLLRADIPVQDVINDELGSDTSVSLAKVLYNIDQQKSDRIDTDLVKQELKDVIELSKRRQLFVNEYNDLKDNPQNYSFTGEKEEFTPEGKKTRTTTPNAENSNYFSKSRDKFKSDKRTYSDLVSQYGEGEKSKYDVLEKIAESPYATVLEKQLASAFLKFTTRDSKIILGDRTLSSAGVSRGGTLGKETAVSSINYEDNAFDYEAGSLPVEHVLLHEIGHDLTVYGLSDTNGQFFKELDPLFKFVQETFKNDPNKYAEAGLIKNGEYYAFKNIYEFATEALSNREFQRYLQTVPYKNTQTSTWETFVNSLKTFFRRLFGTTNENLLNETIAVITNNIDETYKAVKEKNLALEKEEQAMLVTKNEVDRQQDKAELNSGEIATPIPTETATSEAVVKEDESFLKTWRNFFISGTSESENAQTRANAPQHVKNSREFLNNVKNFKNAKRIGAILVTPNNEEAMGLKGLTELQYGRPTTAEDKVTDVDTGFVAQVFVEQDKGKSYFVDKEGKRIGEVGTQIDLSQVIYQAMPTTELYYTYTDPKTGQRVPRYRQGEKENLASAANGWRQERATLFANNTSEHKVYNIDVSRGIAIINKLANGLFERNQIGGILIPESKIASQPKLLQINTAGFVAHKGRNVTFKEKGIVILQYEDVLEVLNNSKLGKEKAKSVYEVLKALALDIREKSTSGKPVDIDVNYLAYLQNVLYLRKGASTLGNQFYIDTNSRSIYLGGVKYPIIDIENKEADIVKQLTDTYHNINSKTIKDLTSKFYEYTGEKNAEGQLVARYWKNYQSYLLSSKLPDGKTSRSSENTPLTTKVAAPTPTVPYSFSQKYATLIDFDLPIIKPVPVAQAAKTAPITPTTPGMIGEYIMDGTTPNTYQFATGPVEFTGTVDADGNVDVVDVIVNDTITKAAENEAILATVDGVLQNIGQYDEQASAEQRVVTFVGGKLIDVLKEIQSTQQAEEVPAVADEAPTTAVEEVSPEITPEEKIDPIDINDTDLPDDNYMRVGVTAQEDVMSENDIQILKDFQAENLPGVPLEVLEDLVDTYDGEKAFGVYVDGVAKFYKAGPRTVGYHELFHPIWKHFLTPEERTALEEEFRNKPGQFTDRASGKKIDYASATDQQVEERYGDDFGEFKVGKLPARSLSELVRNFFRRIINFIMSRNANPSLAKDLFKAIDAGKYKEFTISESQKKGPPAYSRIPGITETQAAEYAEDIFSRAANYIFGENKESIFDLQQITGAEIYNYIKQTYIAGNVYQQLGEERFNALFTQGKQLLRTIGVNFNEEDLVDINDENVTSVGYSQEAFTVDHKKTSPFAIKLVAATLPQVVPTNQQNSTSLKLPVREKSSVGGFKLVNFSRVFATLLDKISNTTSIDRVIDKLVDLASYDATYVRFFQRIGGSYSIDDNGNLSKNIDFGKFKTPEDWRLFINFYQTFTKQKPNALIQYVIGNEVYTAPANQFTITKQVEQDWFSQMRALAKTRNGLVRFNGETKTYQVNTDSELWPEKLPKDPEEMINFLKNLGVTFNMDDYLKLKSTQRDTFGDTVGEIYAYLPQAKDIGTLDGKTLKINKQIAKLAELQVKVTNPNQENTLMGVEGSKKQAYSDNNAPSFFENSFNDSETLEELKISRPELNDVFSKNAITFKEGGLFFNEQGDRFKMIKVSYIDGKKSIDTNKGTSTSKLTKGQRFTQEINQNINGDYYILIPADGATEWMMNLGNHISYEGIVGGRAWDEIYDIFKGYLNDDIALARDWKSRSSLKNIGSKAKDLRFFKEILEVYAPDQLKELAIMIDDEATSDDEFKDYIAKNSKSINNAVAKSIQDIAKGTKDILLKQGEVVSAVKAKTDSENMYKYVGLDSNFAMKSGINKLKMTETQLDNVITFVNANNFINNIEFHKILFGDPYQFKTKDGILDEPKRVKSFLSPRRTTFDSPEFNAFLDSQNKVGDIELTPDDFGYHANKEYASTITLTDVELDTVRYEGVNEADGFSLISDVAYREVKNKNGQWPATAEAWHQYEMAFTRIELAKKGDYIYSKDARGKALKAADEKALLEPQPEHVIDITKPIVSGSQYGENEIKLVVDKMSQMPIYYSAVAGKNLEKLYVKMFKERIDYVIFESGRKLGIENTHSLYNQDGTFNDTPFAADTKVLVPWSINGIQLETSYEGGGEQTRGSQPTKIVTLDMFDNGEETIEGAKEAFDVYNQALKDLDDNSYVELLSKFGVEDLGMGQFELIDPKIISKTLEHELFRRQLSNNAKDTILLDENGEFRIPFEASPAYKQIKDVVYSMVNKSLVSPKMNGGGYVQAPVTGWENSKEGRGVAIKEKDGYRKLSIAEYNELTAAQKSKVVLTSDRLHFPTKEDPYMEVLIPNWFKKSLKGKFANDADLIRELNKSENQGILKGIAFRIPAQAMSSMAAIRVAGFLPDFMGKTVIVPSEITSQAGSDFDIDKLNMYLKSVYVDENGRLHAVDYKSSEKATKEFYGGVYDNTIKKSIEKIGNSDQFRKDLLDVLNAFEQTDVVVSKEQRLFYKSNQDVIDEIISQADDLETLPSEYMTNQITALSEKIEKLDSKLLNEEMKDKYVKTMYKKALENRYFDAFEKLITLEGNYENLIAPVDDAGLKDISKKLDDIRKDDETSIKNRMVNRNYLTNLRHAFLTGKRWVGIVAVNITGHALAQRMKLVMDIDAVADKLTADERRILGDRKIKLKHNEIDGKVSLSGTTTAIPNDKGLLEKISNRLSGYATAVVDIAKDPFIMKIIKSDAAIGTFMFLERIGAGQNTIWFMNQPIISEYLDLLENKGTTFLYNPANINEVRVKFGLLKSGARGTEKESFDVDSLKANIETYANNKNKMSTKQENEAQGAILKEFLKYSKMAEYSFKFTQATNYDTTKFKNSDTFHKKTTRTDVARNKNIFSSVDKLLDSSSIGNQKRLIDFAMKSVGSFIKLEQEQFVDITNEVLRSFEEQEFMKDDDFSKVASKAKASFLDFIVQIKSGLNTEILALTTGENSIAEQLAKAKVKYPNMRLLQDLVPEASKKNDGTQTIKLKVNLKEAYDENLYVEMMRELRELDPDLYNNIVKVALLQGTYQSSISINNIVPIEDYAKKIKPIIDTLVDDADVEYFTKGMFQKNNWKDETIVPTTTPRFYFERDENFDPIVEYVGEDPYGNDVYKYKVSPFLEGFDGPTMQERRLVLTLSPIYDARNGANSDFVKVPKVITNKIGENINIVTGQTISPQAMRAVRLGGDTSLTDVFGYQKVKYSNGSPVTTSNGDYVYKLVNLLGDGNLVSEYYLDGRPSVLNNGTIKIDQEISDAKIIEYFGGDITEEVVSLQTEEEIVAPTQMIGKPKGVEIKEGIYVNQEALSKDEQLELFDYLKPFLEEQAAKTNKGEAASKMIGLGLRWDYKSNNPGKQAMNIPDVINPGNKTKYGYYDNSINNQPLAPITARFRELMQKATGVDMTNYDGAIINLYEPNSFISSHNDVDESRSAIGYPVIGINIGGTGNFSIESRDGAPKQLNLKAGAGYVFGVDGVNREVYHRTFAKPQDSFLPELTTKLDGKAYEPGSYRVTVTMRRVMPLEPGMPSKPAITSTQTKVEQIKPGEQLDLFRTTETFDTIEDFTPERKEEILQNFADKHKMTTEQAKEYINTAIADNKEEVINKLKDCY
jgi:alkylated DNA repair dioxygenase AlkB